MSVFPLHDDQPLTTPARLGPADVKLRQAYRVATAANALIEVATEIATTCPQCANRLREAAMAAVDVSETLEAKS